jgi:hypothetical protein
MEKVSKKEKFLGIRQADCYKSRFTHYNGRAQIVTVVNLFSVHIPHRLFLKFLHCCLLYGGECNDFYVGKSITRAIGSGGP